MSPDVQAAWERFDAAAMEMRSAYALADAEPDLATTPAEAHSRREACIAAATAWRDFTVLFDPRKSGGPL